MMNILMLYRLFGYNAGITDTGAEYLAKAVEDRTSIKAITLKVSYRNEIPGIKSSS